MNTEQIFKNNQDWVAKKLDTDSDYFKKLSQGQSPKYLYIGCSDSRVTAEDLMGAQPGDLFVHRNVANLVPNTDLNAMSVINYAVSHLKVEHAVVCGHYYCGGVKAAMKSDDLAILNPWLSNIRDVYREHRQELNAIDDEDERYNRLVELNVQEQCVNLLKLPEVQKAYQEKRLSIHGWVFDISTGKLIDLNIDFDKVLDGVMGIYEVS